ncbi:MAG: TetR/AcrR family transcriptional regulator [Acidobacteriota bacterium]
MDEKVSESLQNRTGRPVGFVREEAVEAAMNLFWRKGFLAVSAKDLADAMGIQRSSFYNSFGSRESLFSEALQLYATQTPDVPLSKLETGQPVIPVLVRVMRKICQVRAADAEARGCLVCNSIAELVGVENSIGPMLEELVETQVTVLEQLLQQAIHQGEVEPLADVNTAARTFVAFLIGLNTISKVIREEKQLWTMCREFLLGLGIPKPALENLRDN